MAYERTGYAPWSLTREAGVQSATVNGTIDVPQTCQPTINTGVIDEKGNWQGRKSSDRDFIGITKAEGIANGGELLAPDTNNFPSIDMTGFSDVFIAIKPSNGGNYRLAGIMGPDTETFANLAPVYAGGVLRGNGGQPTSSDLEALFDEGAETLVADVWNIFPIVRNLANQKNLQFKIVNNSGGSSDIVFGFMRVV